MTITIEGVDIPAGARLRWLTITPWVGSRFQTHISIPGGDGLGMTYDRGSDNRVATITGITTWNAAGENALDALSGAVLKVTNGAGRSEVTAIADAPTIIDYGGAIIKFSLTLTEITDTGEETE